MITSVPAAFSRELIGHHDNSHREVDIGSWVDSLEFTGKFWTDQELWAWHWAQEHAQESVREVKKLGRESEEKVESVEKEIEIKYGGKGKN